MSEFKVGDRVKWVHTSSGKKVVSWSLREGTIEHIIAGDIAAIRYGKKLNYVPLEALDKADDAMQRLVERYR